MSSATATSRTPNSKRGAFLLGLKEVWPTMFGVVSFGLVSGVTTTAVGLSTLEAISLSILMFAGTAQLAALQLATEGAPFLIVVLTACFVNLRYVMYSASFQPWLQHLSFRWRNLLSYLMVDQTFAFAVPRYQRQPDMPYKHWYYLGISVPLWMTWSSSSVAGILLGAQIPAAWGLEFSLPLIFTALLVSALTDRSSVVAAVVAAVVAVIASGLPYGLGLVIAAITGIAAGVWHQQQLVGSNA